MPEFAMLNNVDHKDLRVSTKRSADLGDNVMFAVTFPGEFRSIQAYYPIVFYEGGDGEMNAVALFGFEQGENLFLQDDGWDAGYVPAMIRRAPFMIGTQKPKDGGSDPVRVLSIDMAHPRVGAEDGEALFQPLGGRTPFLEETASLLESIYAGHAHGQQFVAALKEHKLLEPATFDIALHDGSRNQLLGFHAVHEERMQELSGAVLESFNRKGFLLPLFMVLASLANMRSLIERKNARLAS